MINRCQNEFTTDTAGNNYHEDCPNGPTLDALVGNAFQCREPDGLRAPLESRRVDSLGVAESAAIFIQVLRITCHILRKESSTRGRFLPDSVTR
jgi:hypothetical protein